MKYTLCIGMTPAVQELREFKSFTLGEVNRSPAIHRSVAGKGPNVARVLRQVGGRPLLLGFVGSEFITDNLRREGVAERMIRTKEPTRVCTTLMDHATGTITELVEEAKMPTASEWRQFFATFRRCLPQACYVVIAGALMPGASPEIYRKIARCGVPVIIDSQREPLLGVLEFKPFIVKLNVHELENTLGKVEIIAGARELLKRGAQNVIVTHGAKGAWLVSGTGVWQFRPPRITPVNPIGSGDAVTAGICRALERGENLPEAVRFGMACGAANALTLIAGTVQLPDVRRLLVQVRLRALKNL
ncbi:MAG: Tagatose-6-phosphate kinase [Verrucomicrobiae bacterium]|nr:Tagatose-6-phosphate kinase [Verrucomicrobiae bacterium]